jgi:hypothetical protein
MVDRLSTLRERREREGVMRVNGSRIRLFATVVSLCATAAFAAVPKPRIAVVFEEQVRGVFGLSGSWMDPGRGENALQDALREEGYDVVDAQTVRSAILRDQAIQVLAGDQKAAVAAGSRLQAPFVVAGKGYAKSSGQVVGSSLKSLQATVQLRLLDAGTGDILASADATAARAHVDETVGGGEALAAASAEASAQLIEKMRKIDLTRLKPGGPAAAPLKVSISGLKSYRHFLFIQEWITKNTAGFRGIENEHYTSGSADLDVIGMASGHDFSKKIATAAFEGFSVNPIDVSDTAVALKVIIHDKP